MEVLIHDLKNGIPDALVQSLAAGNSCSIGCCMLYPDDDLGVIWLTDPYGCDMLASSTFEIGDVAAALVAIERAIRVDDGDNLHDRTFLSGDSHESALMQ